MDRIRIINLDGKKKQRLDPNMRKRQSPSSSSDLANVPTKARKMLSFKKTIFDLPESILHIIFQYCSLADLENISISTKQFNLASISFLMSSKSVSITFPFLAKAPLQIHPEEFRNCRCWEYPAWSTGWGNKLWSIWQCWRGVKNLYGWWRILYGIFIWEWDERPHGDEPNRDYN